MKWFRFSLLVMLVGILLSTNSCKKDTAYVAPPDNTDSLKGTFAMNISAVVRGQSFTLNSAFYDVLSYKYKLSTLKFYVSHLSLIKDDNSLQEVDTVFLADYDQLAFGQAITISGKIPPGHYKGAKFWIGLDSIYNHKDATIYPPQDPLSGAYRDTYWGWNSGYRFFMLDGAVDTVPGNTNTTSQPPITCSYHLGTDAQYTEVDMPAHSFDVVKQQVTNYDVQLDVNKIFYSVGDTIIVYRDPYTHATDHTPLALRVAHNLSQAFSAQ